MPDLPFRKKAWRKQETIWSTITIGLGDIQLVTSLAYPLSAFILLRTNSISAYQYNLVCNLGLAAIFTSVTTIFAMPVFFLKKYITGVRCALYILSFIFMGLLLGPRTGAGASFPGRAPSNYTQKDSALVLQASCFFGDPISTNCTFKTDQSPIPVLSDAWALVPLGLIMATALGLNSDWSVWSEVMKNNNMNDPGDSETRRLPRLRLVTEMIVVSISSVWAAVALWQFFALWQWMNSSGWLPDGADQVDSFGQLIPIFQALALLIILVTAIDGKLISLDFRKIQTNHLRVELRLKRKNEKLEREPIELLQIPDGRSDSLELNTARPLGHIEALTENWGV